MDKETKRLSTVDLLSDQLVSVKKVILADKTTRAVDTESAYGAIIASYEELREQLRHAAGLSE